MIGDLLRVNRARIFHPATVLGAALAAALIVGTIVAMALDGEQEWVLLTYVVPIGVPFVAFLFDRAEQRGTLSVRQWVVDVPVIVVALVRAAYPVPFISGHALFLAYALLTTRSWVGRLTAAVILIQVAYIKIVLWHDPTLFGGVIAGVLAATLFTRWTRRRGVSTA